MELSLAQVLTAAAGAATVLCAVILLTARRGKTLHPVFCAHCWARTNKQTIVTFSEEKNQWAICPECTHCYWQFE